MYGKIGQRQMFDTIYMSAWTPWLRYAPTNKGGFVKVQIALGESPLRSGHNLGLGILFLFCCLY